MGLILIDGASSPVDNANPAGPNAAANFGFIDSDGNLRKQTRFPAIGRSATFRASATSANIAATLGANSDLWALGMNGPAAQQVPANSFANKMAVVQSVRVGAVVTGTITTAVQFDLSLFFGRSAGNSGITGGTTIVPTTVPQNALRSSQARAPAATVLISNTGLSHGTSADTNPIGRVQGFTGTAVGTQFFSVGGTNGMVPIYQRENQDAHPIILQTSFNNGMDWIELRNPLAGPATGTFTITVVVEWYEIIKY